MHGLPVIAHQHPVMEYVLGGAGTLGDLNQPGELAGLLAQTLQRRPDDAVVRSRWESVRRRFSWPELAPHYFKMFSEVALHTVL